MKAAAMTSFPHIWLTVAGLLLFFIFFTINCLWVFRKSATRLYENASQLPLKD